MKAGIIGTGVIGGALLEAFKQREIEVSTHDKFKGIAGWAHDFEGVLKSDLCFVCVPTPTVDGEQNLSALIDVLTTLAAESFTGVVVNRCTVLPGTTEKLMGRFGLKVVHNPEFLTAARPLQDLLSQRVVHLGSSDQEALKKTEEFWSDEFYVTHVQSHDSATTTEMIKYMHNLFLATKVSFCNDMYEVCERLGVSYAKVREGAAWVGQIGSGHTSVPGPDGELGYGGMCFPKDMAAFEAFTKRQGLKLETISGAISGNKRRRPGSIG
jgi:UDPglucose 6-dehydrogenase